MPTKILIVEDEEDLIKMICLRAQYNKFVCETDMTGAKCLEKAIKFRPDVILLDLSLPKISGLGLLTELKRHRETAHIPVVVFTALHQSEVVNEAFARGANAYFSKSGNIEDLFRTIQEYALSPSRQSYSEQGLEGAW